MIFFPFGSSRSLKPASPDVEHVSALLRQILRLCLIVLATIALALLLASREPARAAPHSSFKTFIARLWPQAQRAGITRATFDRAFETVSLDQSILEKTQKQAEFSKPIWAYLDSAVSAKRIAQGEAMASEWQQTLNKAESIYGVDSSVILGIWGMETNFGSNFGKTYTISALATLAYAHYRGDYFRTELIEALKILQQGDVSRSNMLGSWAGAMGQTQFMPTAFRKYAVDFNHDGKRDIWSSVPDALASTANYLKKHGWVAGETWGYEVNLPEHFDFGKASKLAFRDWARRGVTRSDGDPMPKGGTGQLLLPAGRQGPAFLVTENFNVIKTYNHSLSYALGVSLLADRIAGIAPVQHDWPRGAPSLTMAQSREIQRHLVRLGYKIGDVDGRIGEKAMAAIRHYQKQRGMIADGYPTAQLLEKMRRSL